MLVAPILAILAWFAVDSIVAEQAHSAKPGANYPLVVKSNCRYESGSCDLANNEFKLTLKPLDASPAVTAFSLESVFGLSQAMVSLVRNGEEIFASVVAVESEQPGTLWTVTLPAATTPDSLLRVAVTAQQSMYFAEVPLTFTQDPDRTYTR